MARIAGIDLPKDKRIDIALSYIYGVGRPLASKVVVEAQVAPQTRVKDLTEAEINKLSTIITRDYKVEGDLRREIQQNVRRLMDIGSYRGFRHRRNLPCRAHRPRPNARTRRGRRRTVGAVRAEAKAAAARTASAPAAK